ncbi:MAG: hypothetical protein COA42_09085 [Alteromonadaceae bacterium]|nr:MAG: hypothetical protein COA42_09085 [Alteromonadaceae bacterium]
MFNKKNLKKALQAPKKKPLVMLVDDEAHNLSMLKRTLGSKYETITCLSGQEALDTITNMDDPSKLQVIISDQRMPSMSGVQLFEALIEIIPDTIRIIVTGYSDMGAIIDSVNKASIYKFISKPIVPEEMLMTVMRAVELQEVRIKAKESERVKEEFIATINHELRTPINGIQGGIQLIRMDAANENLEENLGLIEESTKHMMGLINSILNFTIFQAGVTELKSERANFNRELESLLLHYHQKCLNKNLEFNYRLLPKNMELNTDIEKIQTILKYLLSNAVKFTHTGSIALNVSINQEKNEEKNDTPDVLCLRVQDTGIGIDENLHNDIYGLFKQADSSFSRQYGGLGIGLSLVKRLIEMMGGTISLTSSINQGSTFTVNLPVRVESRRPDADSSHTSKAQANTAYTGNSTTDNLDKQIELSLAATPVGSDYERLDFSHCHILIAEDNHVNQMILKGILEKLSCRVSTCDNGQQAIDWCVKNSADLIFMDCQMPVIDGLEATRQIRNNCPLNSGTPVVAVTANVSEGDRAKCFKVGMNQFLSKPIAIQNITSVLNQFLTSADRTK